MTPYDAAMAGVIVAGMVWGAFKGITWQVASILSLVLGYTVSRELSGQIASYFPGEPVVARALAMITVYLAVSGGIFLGAWLIRATLRKLQFEAYDRHLGMVLGGLEGALLGLVVTLFVLSLAPRTRDPIFKSPSGRVVGVVMATLGPVLPAEARRVLAPFLETPAAEESQAEAAPAVAEASEPVRVAAPKPAQSTAARPTAPRDSAASPVSFRDLIERSEREIGKAVIDGASDGLRKAVKGGTGNGLDGTVKRR